MGRRADLLVLDGNDPYLASAEGDALLNRWLFAGGDRQVRDVMVAGRWVVRDGRHAGEERSARAFVQVLGNCSTDPAQRRITALRLLIRPTRSSRRALNADTSHASRQA